MPYRSYAKKIKSTVKKGKLEVNSVVFVNDVHPAYREHFIKYCELKGYKPIEYKDLRTEAYYRDLESNVTFPRPRGRSSVPTPQIISTETSITEIPQTSSESDSVKTWTAYPSDISFDSNKYSFDSVNDPVFAEIASYTKANIERLRPPSSLNLIELVSKKPNHSDISTLKPYYDDSSENSNTEYHIPYFYGNNTPKFEENSQQKWKGFTQGWMPLSLALQKDIPAYVKAFRAISPGTTSITMVTMVKGKSCEFLLFESCFVEGINYGEIDPDVIEVAGQKYLFKGNHVFSVRPEGGNFRSRCESVANIIDSRPISKEVFKSIFFKSFNTQNKQAIEEAEKAIKRFNSYLMLEEAKLGELLFVEKAVKKNAKTVVEGLIDKIEQIPEIGEFKLTRKGFWFKTNDVYIEFDNKKYYCGVFEISCNIFDKKGFVFRNVESPAKNALYGAAHVLNIPHGSCTGSYNVMLNSCLRELDYYSFVLTFLQMIKNVNPNDTGAMLNFRSYWQSPTKPAETFVSEEIIIYSVEGKRVSFNRNHRDNEENDYEDDDN